MTNVILNLLGKSAAIYVHLVDAIHGKEFQGILDEWGVGKWKQTLNNQSR